MKIDVTGCPQSISIDRHSSGSFVGFDLEFTVMAGGSQFAPAQVRMTRNMEAKKNCSICQLDCGPTKIGVRRNQLP